MAIRLTEPRLRQIIREEASRLRRLREAPMGPAVGARAPRTMRTYEYTLYAAETDLPRLQSIAARVGAKIVGSEPTGEMAMAFDDEGYELDDAPEVAVVIHGPMKALREFYYAMSEDEMAQSTEEFDARELGIRPVR
jgi:hypothetical protein